MVNYFSTEERPMPSELIGNLYRCYRMHLREGRIKFRNTKLLCFVPICGNTRFVTVMIVPHGLRRIVFDAYHSSGTGAHVKLIKP